MNGYNPNFLGNGITLIALLLYFPNIIHYLHSDKRSIKSITNCSRPTLLSGKKQ